MDLETARAINRLEAINVDSFLREIEQAARADSRMQAFCDANLVAWSGAKINQSRSALSHAIEKVLTSIAKEADQVIEQAKITRIEQEIAQPGPVVVTVPDEWATFGKRTAKSWARTVYGIVSGKGAYMYEGGFLKRGRKVELPIGTLFLCYDQGKSGSVNITLHIAVFDNEGYGYETIGEATTDDWAIDLKPTIRNWLKKTGKIKDSGHAPDIDYDMGY